MPDWSYRTLFQPLLFRLPTEFSRDLALGAMGRLAALPGGTAVISLMGHMAPDRRLETQLGKDWTISAPVGISSAFDPHAFAAGALAMFGCGWIEFGPLLAGDQQPATGCLIQRDPAQQALLISQGYHANEEQLFARLGLTQGHGCQRWLRICLALFDGPTQAEAARLVERFHDRIDAVVLEASQTAAEASEDPSWRDGLAQLAGKFRERGGNVVLAVSLDHDNCHEVCGRYLTPALGIFAEKQVPCAVLLDGRRRHAISSQTILGALLRDQAIAAVAQLRAELPPGVALLAGGGVHSPEDALALLAAGATAVQIDTGIVYAGPGLPKRINQAVLFSRKADLAGSDSTRKSPRFARSQRTRTFGLQAWFWLWLHAAALLGGGLLALAIALTRIVLPYDEAYLGLSRAQIDALNPHLLAFMQHDRVTLAGVMLAVGVYFLHLAWFGVRRGIHWCWAAFVAAALVGFASFFLFLGFGYFDPFHAFVTAAMMSLLLLGMAGRLGVEPPSAFPNLRETPAWRRALWAQLLMVAHGAALLVAGSVICGVGSTFVFVPEDLEFLQTTREALVAAHPRLIPVVAHDRASFGGMLLSSGVATLLCGLWGFQQGATWQWRAYLLAGLVGYGTTLAIHHHVQYTSPIHLAPAWAGLLTVVIGSALSWEYFQPIDAAARREWGEWIARYRRGTTLANP